MPPDADAEYGRLPDDWDGPDWYYGRQTGGVSAGHGQPWPE